MPAAQSAKLRNYGKIHDHVTSEGEKMSANALRSTYVGGKERHLAQLFANMCDSGVASIGCRVQIHAGKTATVSVRCKGRESVGTFIDLFALPVATLRLQTTVWTASMPAVSCHVMHAEAGRNMDGSDRRPADYLAFAFAVVVICLQGELAYKFHGAP